MAKAPAPKQIGGSRQAGVKKAPPKKAPPKKAPPKIPVYNPPQPVITPAQVAAAAAKQGSSTPTPKSPANPNLLPGAVDPFAGTPYAGMSPYQIAQKIVQDEIDAQTKGINAQRDAQVQANTNALSILSQLGQQLQSGAGQFATNYNASLQGTGIGSPGGGDQGGPPTGEKSFQGFNAGYQAAQGLINNGMGASNPNQPGGPSAAQPLGAGVSGGDAQNITNTAISTNPFAVLPSAYGRMAQMDANLLAANQAKSLTAYSQAVLDLYSSANKDIFDEFNQIKSEFDAANGAVTSAQADAAAQQAKDAADQQKTYQWQYHEAAARAAELTNRTGLLYQPDPKTLQPVLVRDKQGNPVVTLQGKQAGVRNAATQASTQARLKQLAISDANLKERIAHDKVVEANANSSLAMRKAAAARISQNQKVMQQNAAARLKIAQDANARAAKKAAQGPKASTSPNAVGSPAWNQKYAKQHADLVLKARQELESLTTGSKSGSVKVDKNGNPVGNTSAHVTKPKLTVAQAKIRIAKDYLPQFIRIARALIQGGQYKGYTPRQVADFWLTQIIG